MATQEDAAPQSPTAEPAPAEEAAGETAIGETASDPTDIPLGTVEIATEPADEIGLPQLRPDDFGPQLVWLALVFGALYFIMSRVTLPRIAAVIEERRDRIADDLDKAAESKREADKALAEYRQALDKANARARAIGSEARERAKEDGDRQRAETDAKIAELMRDAERRLDEAKNSALTHLETLAADTAAAIMKKLLGTDVDSGSAAAAVKTEIGRR